MAVIVFRITRAAQFDHWVQASAASGVTLRQCHMDGVFVFGTDVGQGTGLDINNQMVDLLKGGLATTV